MSSLQKPSHYRKQGPQLKKERNQNDTKKISAGDNNNSNNNCGQANSNTHNNKIASIGNANSTNNRADRKPGTVYPPCETCGKTNHYTEEYYFGANAANRPSHGTEDRWNKLKINKKHGSTQLKMSRLMA